MKLWSHQFSIVQFISKHKKPKDLANNLVETVSTELKNANLKNTKLENLNTAYSFIKTHTSLSSQKDVNSDSGLGIVLTPPHVKTQAAGSLLPGGRVAGKKSTDWGDFIKQNPGKLRSR